MTPDKCFRALCLLAVSSDQYNIRHLLRSLKDLKRSRGLQRRISPIILQWDQNISAVRSSQFQKILCKVLIAFFSFEKHLNDKKKTREIVEVEIFKGLGPIVQE